MLKVGGIAPSHECAGIAEPQHHAPVSVMANADKEVVEPNFDNNARYCPLSAAKPLPQARPSETPIAIRSRLTARPGLRGFTSPRRRGETSKRRNFERVAERSAMHSPKHWGKHWGMSSPRGSPCTPP